MRYPYGETVTWVSRTANGVDALGNTVFDEAPMDLTNVPVWPRDGNSTASNELQQGRDQVIVGLAAVLPPEIAAKAVDRMIYRGNTYEIEGEPGILRSPFTGWQPGVVVALKRVTG